MDTYLGCASIFFVNAMRISLFVLYVLNQMRAPRCAARLAQAVHEQNKLHKKSEALEIDVSRLTGTSKAGQRSF